MSKSNLTKNKTNVESLRTILSEETLKIEMSLVNLKLQEFATSAKRALEDYDWLLRLIEGSLLFKQEVSFLRNILDLCKKERDSKAEQKRLHKLYVKQYGFAILRFIEMCSSNSLLLNLVDCASNSSTDDFDKTSTTIRFSPKRSCGSVNSPDYSYSEFSNYNDTIMDNLVRYIKQTLIYDNRNYNDELDEYLKDNPITEPEDDQYDGDDEDLHPQSAEQYIDDITRGFDWCKRLRNSQFMRYIYKLIMFGVSFSIFKKFGVDFDITKYHIFQKDLMKNKYNSTTDFVETLIESILYFLKKGFQVMRTGRLDCIVHSREEYTMWFDSVQVLKRKSNLLANPEAHGFNEHSFRSDLDACIEKGEAIYQIMDKREDYERRLIKSLLNEMLMIKFDLTTKQAAREVRKPPFSILICGDSGIGKSTIKDILFYHFGKIKNLETDSQYIYTRNFNAKYWDGFTTSMWAVVLDDVAFMHPNKAMNGDPSVMEFLQVINPVPFVPDQADLADKGRTPLKAKLCIATTNTEDLNAHYYFSCASAAQRRFPYIIEPKVKREYATEDGMLDSSKVPQFEGYPNLWDWTIKKVHPVPIDSGKRKADIKTYAKYKNVNDFIKWYSSVIQEFDANQERVSQSVNSIKMLKICTTCYLPSVECECQLQVGEITAIQFYGNFYWLLEQFLLMFACLLVQSSLLLNLGVFLKSEKLMDIHYSVKIYYTAKMAIAKTLYARKKIAQVGEMIQKRYTPMTLIALGSVPFVAYMLYSLVSKLFEPGLEPQMSEKDIGVSPDPMSVERENVWYKNDFVLSPYYLTPQTTSTVALTKEAVAKVIARQCAAAYVMIPGKDKFRQFKMFCLKGQTYVCNNHCMPKVDSPFCLRLVFQSSKDGITTNREMLVEESMFQRREELDICVVRLKSLAPRRGIWNFLPKSTIDVKCNGMLVCVDQDGQQRINEINKIFINTANDAKGLENYKGVKIGYYATNPPSDGDCGSLVVVSTPLGYCVIGMHFLGNPNLSLSAGTYFDRSVFSPGIVDDEILDSHLRLQSRTAGKTLVGLHSKSPVRYVTNGTAQVFGSFVETGKPPKSRVEKTPMNEYLQTYGYETHFTKPMMKGWLPKRIALVDSVHENSMFREPLLHYIVENMKLEIMNLLPEDQWRLIQPYDTFTAVNGAAGVSYVDKINRNTSAGFPWNKSKRYFMASAPESRGLQSPVELSQEIIDEINIILDQYSKGERANPIFTAALKDEPVSLDKAAKGKTRVFSGAPLPWVVVVRKMCLSMIRVIQNNRYVFESGPGTVAQAYEWHDLRNYICKYGEHRIVAGDYKRFDKIAPPAVIAYAFEILVWMAKQSGSYTDEEIKCLQGIAIDTTFPITNYFGDLIQFDGTVPSGHPLTVIINCFINSIYMRYVYLMLNPAKEVFTFRENVSLMTYGDDNIMSVSDKIDFFNHTTISAMFEQLDIEYTMADKNETSIPFIHINQATFLKRSWRLDDDVGAFLAPLEPTSIEKMLMVWVKSKTISREEQMIAVCESAIREYFFYGKIIYNEKRDMFLNMVKHFNLEIWVKDNSFPLFEDLVKDFWDRSFKLGYDRELLQYENPN